MQTAKIIVVHLIWFYCWCIKLSLSFNVFIIKLAFFIVELFIYVAHAALWLSHRRHHIERKRHCSYMQKLSILWRLPSVHKCDCWWILLPSIYVLACTFLCCHSIYVHSNNCIDCILKVNLLIHWFQSIFLFFHYLNVHVTIKSSFRIFNLFKWKMYMT